SGQPRDLHSFPTRRSSDLGGNVSLTINDNAFVEIEGNTTIGGLSGNGGELHLCNCTELTVDQDIDTTFAGMLSGGPGASFIKDRSEEHTSELQSRENLVCR